MAGKGNVGLVNVEMTAEEFVKWKQFKRMGLHKKSSTKHLTHQLIFVEKKKKKHISLYCLY
jgi:hypothetical protein